MGKKPTKIRIVLDTNGLVSALLFGGRTGRLLSLWESGRIVPLLSKEVLLEYVRVLGYPKFALGADDIKGLIEEHVLPFAEMIPEENVAAVIDDDPADDKFLALAAAGRADFIVSGDKHLLSLGRYDGAEIVTPKEFLDRPELREMTEREGS
jgi:putative PIN family toxin of toxin-antitoxin system